MLPYVDARACAFEARFVDVTRAGRRLPIPRGLDRHRDTAQRVLDRVVAEVLDALDARVLAGDALELLARQHERPSLGAADRYVRAEIDRLVRESGPLHQVDHVHADIGEALAVLRDIEEPRRPA